MPKVIRFSVGRGGQNSLPQDVMTVQYLLNCVPYSKGGPSPELAVDGIAGPKTAAAITCFQRACITHADGRVDPGGPTLSRLQQFDPYPGQPMPASPAFKQGDKQVQPKGIKDPNQPGYKQAGFKDPYQPGSSRVCHRATRRPARLQEPLFAGHQTTLPAWIQGSITRQL